MQKSGSQPLSSFLSVSHAHIRLSGHHVRYVPIVYPESICFNKLLILLPPYHQFSTKQAS